jgi:hypothetical protein
MEMAPPDCEMQDQPVDPDLAWTHWALATLATLAEVVDIQLRTARMTAMEQQATPILRPKPDFALAQVRLARSVRLSIAMSQRVRETYQERKAGKVDRTPAAPADAAPAAAPKDGDRPEPRETLTESECLEAEREPGEEAEERRDLDAALLPRDQDGGAGVERPDFLPPNPAPDAPAEAVAPRPEPDWPWLSDESDTGRSMPTLPKPDSS